MCNSEQEEEKQRCYHQLYQDLFACIMARQDFVSPAQACFILISIATEIACTSAPAMEIAHYELNKMLMESFEIERKKEDEDVQETGH